MKKTATRPSTQSKPASNQPTNGATKKAIGSIDSSRIHAFQAEFESRPENRIALNAVTKTPLPSVSLNRQRVVENNHVFSIQLKSGDATSQNASGRCWLFAGLNPMRAAMIEKYKLDAKFELSQNYLMFWDKLERANYFLESILKTVDEPVGSRLLDYLLKDPIQDGGQWDMFVNLIRKYGVVPKSIMPETESSSATRWMNHTITHKLREFAAELREASERGESNAKLRARKDEMLSIVYRMLAIHLGEPPKRFEWQYRDKEDKFHRIANISPQEFFKKYVPYDIDSKVCLIHCPQSSKQFGTVYTLDYLGNVIDGDIIRYLNVELQVLKNATIEMLKSGETVWFGADVGKMMDRDLGMLDMDIYDFSSIYGIAFGLDKASRLDYGHSAMNHAMVFTGVDLDSKGNPKKWRVENSWGEQVGDKGYFAMSDNWFDEYVYEVAVDKKFVPKNLLKAFEKEPVHLPPWDPMGALATKR
jgi:bleomycin hydrolase